MPVWGFSAKGEFGRVPPIWTGVTISGGIE